MTTKQSTTFEVANVSEGKPYNIDYTSVPVELATRVGQKLNFEAFSQNTPLLRLWASSNALIDLVQASFADHIPLVLTPDAIWTTIAQSVANHINIYSDKLRSKLVDWQGKREILVERDDFVKGNPDNDWESVFGEFSKKIEESVGDRVHGYVNNRFSTTSDLEAVAHAVTVMDAFKSYFKYTVGTMCGIPRITLEGTHEDWTQLLESVNQLEKLDSYLNVWLDHVKVIATKFADASQGIVDTEWWNSFFKLDNISGGPFINGHITKLFAYLVNGGRLELNRTLTKESCWGLKGDQFPTSVSKAPVLWKYYDQEFSLDFIAGIAGVGYSEEENTVRPAYGWAIAEKE